MHEGLNKHYDVLKNEVILIYKIVLRPSVRPSVYPSVRLNIHHSTRVLERARKSRKKRKVMERAVERKEFKILHFFPMRIKGSKAFSKSKRRRPVFGHILKITNSGK